MVAPIRDGPPPAPPPPLLPIIDPPIIAPPAELAPIVASMPVSPVRSMVSLAPMAPLAPPVARSTGGPRARSRASTSGGGVGPVDSAEPVANTEPGCDGPRPGGTPGRPLCDTKPPPRGGPPSLPPPPPPPPLLLLLPAGRPGGGPRGRTAEPRGGGPRGGAGAAPLVRRISMAGCMGGGTGPPGRRRAKLTAPGTGLASSDEFTSRRRPPTPDRDTVGLSWAATSATGLPISAPPLPPPPPPPRTPPPRTPPPWPGGRKPKPVPSRSATNAAMAAARGPMGAFDADTTAPGVRKVVARCGEATMVRSATAEVVAAAEAPPVAAAAPGFGLPPARLASALSRLAIMAYHCASALVRKLDVEAAGAAAVETEPSPATVLAPPSAALPPGVAPAPTGRRP